MSAGKLVASLLSLGLGGALLVSGMGTAVAATSTAPVVAVTTAVKPSAKDAKTAKPKLTKAEAKKAAKKAAAKKAAKKAAAKKTAKKAAKKAVEKKVAARPTLRPGKKGAEVTRLQKLLKKSGYWLPKVDGDFGSLTQQAVYAVQKTIGVKRTGIADATVWRALYNKKLPKVAAKKGTVLEVDISKQILSVVVNGKVKRIYNVSTGNGARFKYGSGYSTAITPRGNFTVTRKIDGYRTAELGTMYRPHYFRTGGYAIHGSGSIPATPASHGCIRISNPGLDNLRSTGYLKIGTKIQIHN